MRILVILPLLFASTAAFAADCKSVAGNIDGGSVTAKRVAVLQGSALQLSGTIDGSEMPHQNLPCLPFAGGVMCERRSASALVTITTKGPQMVETISDLKTGEQRVKITYECTQAFTLTR